MDILTFITVKMKRAGLKREDLAKWCKVSQTTMHRYIHGEFIIYPDKEADLAVALKLSDAEREEFREIIAQTIPKKPMQKAFQAMDALVFGGGAADGISPEREILILDKDRFSMKGDQFFKRFLRNAKEADFQCTGRLLYGVNDDYFPKITDFIEELFRLVPQATVEHLIAISARDYTKSIQVLAAALPLLKHSNYALLYARGDHNDDAKRIFQRVIYISTSWLRDGERKYEHFLLSRLDQDQPECYVFSDPLLHEFITSDYIDVRRDYENSFHEFRNLDIGEEFLIDMEHKHDFICIKPNQSFNHIPVTAYNKLIGRTNLEVKRRCAKMIAGSVVADAEVDAVLERLIAAMEARIQASYTRRQIDVCSKAGLLEFVKTGRLSDHMVWLPEFNKQEIRLCLEFIRDRSNDPQDPYQLYITEKDILENGYILYAYKDAGVFIEYNEEFYKTLPVKNLYIKNKNITEVLCSYAEAHIPASHAIPADQATAYIDWLIKTYLQK